jgi:putative spermidine/putrescine transport system substrate-binding protein
MRARHALGALAALAIAVTAAGCGSSDTAAPAPTATDTGGGSPTTTTAPPPLGGTMPTSIGAGEGALNLVNWAGYAESGGSDKNYDWVHPFQTATGCVVNSKVAGTSDEMVKLMATGSYDGVSASGNASTRLILAGDAAPVNVDLVKNYADLSPFLKDQSYNTYNGVHYGIPHGWGANLLMWRPDKVTPDPTSWSVVFDASSPYKGKITAYDDPIYIADAALYLKSAQPALGITDPYELTDAQFTAVTDLLKVQRGLIGQYWSDATKELTAFEAGDLVLGTTWQYQANTIALDKKTTVKTIVPSEGSTGWSDTWMVYAKAAHPNCMYMWLDWITKPDVQASVASWFGEAPANPAACDVIATSDATFCDTFHAKDEAFYKGIAFWKVPLAECGDARGKTCKGYADWLSAWQSIKG